MRHAWQRQMLQAVSGCRPGWQPLAQVARAYEDVRLMTVDSPDHVWRDMGAASEGRRMQGGVHNVFYKRMLQCSRDEDARYISISRQRGSDVFSMAILFPCALFATEVPLMMCIIHAIACVLQDVLIGRFCRLRVAHLFNPNMSNMSHMQDQVYVIDIGTIPAWFIVSGDATTRLPTARGSTIIPN